jgi:hypothetical protein
LSAQWKGVDALQVSGPILPGNVVAVQVSNDAGWQARQNGQALEITKDHLAHIELRYRGTIEQKVMAAWSALAWVGAILALFK